MSANLTQPEGDYIPWSDDEEDVYERAMAKRDQAVYEALNDRFEAEGGDATIELAKEGKLSSNMTESNDLSAMQQAIVDGWKDYP